MKNKIFYSLILFTTVDFRVPVFVVFYCMCMVYCIECVLGCFSILLFSFLYSYTYCMIYTVFCVCSVLYCVLREWCTSCIRKNTVSAYMCYVYGVMRESTAQKTYSAILHAGGWIYIWLIWKTIFYPRAGEFIYVLHIKK